MASILLVATALVLVALAASILLTYARTGAPPVPSSTREVKDVIALLRRAQLSARPVIYELGCGWGGLAGALAEALPEARVIGIELSPLPYAVARWRARRVENLEVRWGDFHRDPLDGADAVVAYLMIAPMIPLAATLDRRLRPRTPVVTVTFWFRDRTPVASLGGSSGRGGVALYDWRP